MKYLVINKGEKSRLLNNRIRNLPNAHLFLQQRNPMLENTYRERFKVNLFISLTIDFTPDHNAFEFFCIWPFTQTISRMFEKKKKFQLVSPYNVNSKYQNFVFPVVICFWIILITRTIHTTDHPLQKWFLDSSDLKISKWIPEMWPRNKYFLYHMLTGESNKCYEK